MGEAKRRGTKEERATVAIERNADAARARAERQRLGFIRRRLFGRDIAVVSGKDKISADALAALSHFSGMPGMGAVLGAIDHRQETGNEDT